MPERTTQRFVLPTDDPLWWPGCRGSGGVVAAAGPVRARGLGCPRVARSGRHWQPTLARPPAACAAARKLAWLSWSRPAGSPPATVGAAPVAAEVRPRHRRRDRVCDSEKDAAATWKHMFRFHPLLYWSKRREEALAGMLRPVALARSYAQSAAHLRALTGWGRSRLRR